MQQKVTAKRLQDYENIAIILQYIDQTHPTKQQLQQKFQKQQPKAKPKHHA